MSKFLISVGHTSSGNTGCGAVGFLNESDCTRQIAPLVVSKLQSLGHTAVKLQVDNSDAKDYVKRTSQANSQGGDYFVEIHLNAGGGTGCEVLTTSGSSAGSLAAKVSLSISNKLGIANRGHKTTSGLYVLNHTSMPAILIECCFVDNSIDYNAYNADKIANAIVEGLTGESISKPLGGVWIEDEFGWWYKHNDKSYTRADWELINGKWYYFNYRGYMCTGWVNVRGKDYLLYSDGSMAHDCEMYGYRFASSGEATKIE